MFDANNGALNFDAAVVIYLCSRNCCFKQEELKGVKSRMAKFRMINS